MSICKNSKEIQHCIKIENVGAILAEFKKIESSVVGLNNLLTQNNELIVNNILSQSAIDVKRATEILGYFIIKKNNILVEKDCLTNATEKEIKNYLEKTEIVVNEFSTFFINERKNNPFLALRADSQNKYIGLNQRNKITSLNGLKKDIQLDYRSIKSKSNTKTGVPEAPSNELTFIYSRSRWIPFFIEPYIATDLSLGLAIYAKNERPIADKLTSIDIFNKLFPPNKFLLKNQIPTKAGVFYREVDSNGNESWKEQKEAFLETATQTNKGLIAIQDIITPKKLDNLFKYSDKLPLPSGTNSNNVFVMVGGTWKDLASYNKTTATTKKSLADQKIIIPQDSKDENNPGLLQYGQLSTNAPDKALESKEFANLTTSNGYPLLKIPPELDGYDGYYVQTTNGLKEIKTGSATTAKAGLMLYAKESDKTNKKKAMNAMLARKYITQRLIYKDNYDPTSTKIYGIRKRTSTTAKDEFETVEITNNPAQKATTAQSGVLALKDACTMQDILNLASMNLISRRTKKLSSINAGRLEYINISDFVLYSNAKNKETKKEHFATQDKILKLSTERQTEQSEIIAVLTKQERPNDNKIIIYQRSLSKGLQDLIKIFEIPTNKHIDSPDDVFLAITKKINYKGNQIENNYVIFLVDKQYAVPDLTIISVEHKNGMYTEKKQVENKKLTYLKGSNVIKISTMNQSNGGIELVIASNKNAGVFEYFDIDQLKIRLNETFYLRQKIQPFSNEILKLLKQWQTKITSGHYIYDFIDETVIRQADFYLEAIIQEEDKISMLLASKSYKTTIEIVKKQTKIVDYYISRNEEFENDISIISNIYRKNNIYFIARNKTTNEIELYMYDGKIHKINTLPNTDIKNHEVNILFQKNGISVAYSDGNTIKTIELESSGTTRDFGISIIPDTKDDEIKANSLVYTY